MSCGQEIKKCTQAPRLPTVQAEKTYSTHMPKDAQAGSITPHIGSSLHQCVKHTCKKDTVHTHAKETGSACAHAAHMGRAHAARGAAAVRHTGSSWEVETTVFDPTSVFLSTH